MKYSTLEGAILQTYAQNEFLKNKENEKMAWTDDPVRDSYGYERVCQRRLSRHPKCDCCGEYITEDRFYRIEEQNLCEECVDHLYAEDTEDFIEGD